MGGTINEQFPVGVTKTMVLEGQLRRVTAERDQLRAELAAAKEHLGIAINNAAGWRKRTAERRQKMKELAAHVERIVGALNRAYEQAARQLAEPRNHGNDQFVLTDIATICERALAATPAQSLEAVTAPLKANVERLQKALEEERTRLEYDKKHRSHNDYVEVSVDELNERIEAISSALGSTKEGA